MATEVFECQYLLNFGDFSKSGIFGKVLFFLQKRSELCGFYICDTYSSCAKIGRSKIFDFDFVPEI